MNQHWRSCITIEPGKRGGRPCIRDMRHAHHCLRCAILPPIHSMSLIVDIIDAYLND